MENFRCLFTFKCDWTSLVPPLGAERASCRRSKRTWTLDSGGSLFGSWFCHLWSAGSWEKHFTSASELWFLYLWKIGIRGQIKPVRIKQCMWYCFINYIHLFQYSLIIVASKMTESLVFLSSASLHSVSQLSQWWRSAGSFIASSYPEGKLLLSMVNFRGQIYSVLVTHKLTITHLHKRQWTLKLILQTLEVS